MEDTLAWTIRGLKFGDFLFMLKATIYTLELASVAIGGGLVLALIIGILRTTKKAKFLNYISRIYVEVFRGTPVVYSCENCHLFLLKVYQLSIIHFLLFYFKQSGNFMSINFIVSPIK